MSDTKLRQAHELLQAKEYKKAYYLLQQMPDNPTARAWLNKLEAMKQRAEEQRTGTVHPAAPPAKPKSAVITAPPAAPARADVPVYALPQRKQRIVTKLDPTAVVTPLGFLAMPEKIAGERVEIRWVNIMFRANGQQLFGWVPQPESPLVYNRPLDQLAMSDLPQHTNAEIDRLIDVVRRDTHLAGWGRALLAAGPVMAVCGWLTQAVSQSDDATAVVILVIFVLFAISFFRGFFAWLVGQDRERNALIRYLRAVKRANITGEPIGNAQAAVLKQNQQRNRAAGLAAGAAAVIGAVAVAAVAAKNASQPTSSTQPRTTVKAPTSRPKPKPAAPTPAKPAKPAAVKPKKAPVRDRAAQQAALRRAGEFAAQERQAAQQRQEFEDGGRWAMGE